MSGSPTSMFGLRGVKNNNTPLFCHFLGLKKKKPTGSIKLQDIHKETPRRATSSLSSCTPKVYVTKSMISSPSSSPNWLF